MLSTSEFITRLHDKTQYDWEVIGSIGEAFAWMLGANPRKCDPDYKRHFCPQTRSKDRYDFEFREVKENRMRDRLVRCDYEEFVPGIWRKKSKS